MKRRYEDWTPGPDALVVVAQANQIAGEYQAQGYDLTLRQLYYQFVARDLIPNTDRSYKRLGSIVNRARMAGLMDWSYIVDRTRNIAGVGYHQTEEEALASVEYLHSVDHWADQSCYAEVWVEKEALAGVVQRAASAWDAPYFSCRGYPSQSEVWGAAQRLLPFLLEGRDVTILHLGDHDPSGIDMTRDIRDRLHTFLSVDGGHAVVESYYEAVGEDPDKEAQRLLADRLDAMVGSLEVRRIALNMDQIEEHQPPPNPAKMTDSRVGEYVRQFGSSSWELDALEPSLLDGLIQDNIAAMVDHGAWERAEEAEAAGRARLRSVAARYSELVDDES